MRTESVVEDNRNPPAYLETSTLHFLKDHLKDKTSLEEDVYLNDFINFLSPLFTDTEEFLKGATFAHHIIKSVPGISLPDEVSKDTVDGFKEEVEKDYERRKSLNLDTDWYVKDPKSKNPTIYRRNTDRGEKMLKAHLYFTSLDYGDLTEYFRGFENPQFKTGAFTVFTLKNLEAQRTEEDEASQQMPAPIPLVPNMPRLIKSA